MFSLEAALIQFWVAQDRIYWGWGKAGGSKLLLFSEKRLGLLLVAAVIYYEVCRRECMVEVTLIRTLKAQTRKKTWRIQMKPAYKPRGAEDPDETEHEPPSTSVLCTLRASWSGWLTVATATPSERPEDKRSASCQPSGIREPFVMCRPRGDTEKELHRLQQRKFVKPRVTYPSWTKGTSARRDRGQFSQCSKCPPFKIAHPAVRGLNSVAGRVCRLLPCTFSLLENWQVFNKSLWHSFA